MFAPGPLHALRRNHSALLSPARGAEYSDLQPEQELGDCDLAKVGSTVGSMLTDE